jgi:hypothetical protein
LRSGSSPGHGTAKNLAKETTMATRRRRAAGLEVLGSPRRARGIHDDEISPRNLEKLVEGKRTECAHYQGCMNYASALDWPQFHCRQCTQFVERDDHDAMIEDRVFARIGNRFLENSI